MELSEYSDGGQRSFNIISKSQEGSGWGNCVSQMRCVVMYFEQKGVVRSTNGEVFGSNLGLLRTVEHKHRS
jgi:hypothetical protein